MPLNEHVRRGRQRLDPVSDTPSLDAQLLLMRVLGQPRAWLLAHPEFELSPQQQEIYDGYIERCVEGEALPFVLGWWEFFGRQFHLTPDVLIPRPETEHLVERALASLAKRMEQTHVLDLGTGSACILVTLALEMPQHRYAGSDISQAALRVAQKNLFEYRLETEVSLVQADLLAPFDGPIDLITANLPYIPSDRLPDLKVAQKEPQLALDGGADGLQPVRRLVGDLARVLAPGGELLLELDPEQMGPAMEIVQGVLDWDEVKIFDDLAGQARVLHAAGRDGVRKSSD